MDSLAQRTWRGTLCGYLTAAAIKWSAIMSTSVQEIAAVLENAIVLKGKLVTLFPHPGNKGM